MNTRVAASFAAATSSRASCYRIVQIVRRSKMKIETEIPRTLEAWAAAAGETFTFHAARMRRKRVSKGQLEEIDSRSGRHATAIDQFDTLTGKPVPTAVADTIGAMQRDFAPRRQVPGAGSLLSAAD